MAGCVAAQFNTCFWALVKGGASRAEAQAALRVRCLWWPCLNPSSPNSPKISMGCCCSGACYGAVKDGC